MKQKKREKWGPGPLAKQRTQSACPTREAIMPRLSKLGIAHIFSALSSHAVTSTEHSPPARRKGSKLNLSETARVLASDRRT
eukprot:1503714-Prymnesium_polylepis.1